MRRVLTFTATSVLAAVVLVAGAAALPVPRVVGQVMLSVAIGGVGLGGRWTWGNLLGLACYILGGLLVFVSVASTIGAIVN